MLVVDNASSDGTGDWLASRPTTGEVPLSRVPGPQPGGRGWLPRRAGLGDRPRGRPRLADRRRRPARPRLPGPALLRTGELDFWGPLVVDEADPDRLVFPIRLPGGTRVVHALDDVRGAARSRPDRRHRHPVQRGAGHPGAGRPDRASREEFFIWGDDHEYRLRAEEAGARVATVVNAGVRHPSVGNLGTPMMFGRTTYNDSPERPQALLHGSQQPGQPARLPRPPPRAWPSW